MAEDDKPRGLKSSNQAMQPFDRRASEKRRDNFEGSSGLLFEQAMAQTRMAVCLTDPHLEDDPIVFCNEAFENLTGYSRDEVVGRNCRFLQGPDTDENQVARIRKALANEDVAVVELLNYRKDGTSFWNTLHLGPIYDDDGKLRYFFGSQWDVTDIHQARAQERHAKAIAREVSHRLKNVFSVIGGIVNVTGRAMDARPVARKINERVQALGRSYEPTFDDAVLGNIDIGQAIRSVLAPYDSGGRITYDGPDSRAEPNVVSVIGLSLHELATNATKYGALSTEDGHVDVQWSYRRGEEGLKALTINWIEHGGPEVSEPDENDGTGIDILRNLLQFTRGELKLDWKSEGLHACIDFPFE
ncbi:PAS domain-containing protein [Sphingomicrobium sp. XHP0235]|uniref:PAS domain-containing protein n=1 Tax=Sphingomicrobium aquimarinum TaxID=3133971 RepID=UPI0031FED028